MTLEIGLLLLILAVALICFAFEWVPADVVALGVLLALIGFGLIPAREAFSGFGSDTVIMMLGLLILTTALLKTGVVDFAGRTIIQRTGNEPNRLLIVVMISSATLGAFMSNTASTAFFVPVVFGVAKRAKISPAKLLMPLAFSSILSSSITLVSTSTNIVVSGLMTRHKLEPMGMFEMAPVGIPIAIVGIFYMFYIGRRLIPDRRKSDEIVHGFELGSYLTEIIILPNSPLVGKTLSDAKLGSELDLMVVRIVRDKDQYLAPRSDTILKERDVLLVEGSKEEILKIKDEAGIEIKADFKLSGPSLQSDEIRLVEVILMPGSPLIWRTLKRFRFREKYGLQVLAINRRGDITHRKISQLPLRMGDVLLVQGPAANIAALVADRTFRVLGEVEERRFNPARARVAVTIFVGVLLLATFKWISFPVAALTGAFLVFLTRCISPQEAYRDLEWRLLILIGSMLGLGAAMEHTGAEKFLASKIVDYFGDIGAHGLLTGFFILTIILTQPMSNQAAAVVVLPVAIQTAIQLGLNPRTFAMMIAIAASCSYLTPLEPSCLLVYGPGRYRFMDFLKVGSLLTLFIYIIAILLVPIVWPL